MAFLVAILIICIIITAWLIISALISRWSWRRQRHELRRMHRENREGSFTELLDNQD